MSLMSMMRRFESWFDNNDRTPSKKNGSGEDPLNPTEPPTCPNAFETSGFMAVSKRAGLMASGYGMEAAGGSGARRRPWKPQRPQRK